MGWMAAIVREPAASRGSSTGRMRAGQMAAGTARARWGCALCRWTECVSMCVYSERTSVDVGAIKDKGGIQFREREDGDRGHALFVMSIWPCCFCFHLVIICVFHCT